MSGKNARDERREERLREEGQGARAERRKRLLQVGSGAVFLAIVVVAVLIVATGGGDEGGDAANVEGATEVSQELQGIQQDGLTLGDPSAQVTLIEFGDLQCPVCKKFSEDVVPEVIESKVRSGLAKIEFRNFTIISDQSVDAGAAAIAAGEQGRGWSFIELFYTNQGAEGSGYVTDDFLTEIARGAGVPDLEKWNTDRRSKRVLGEVTGQTKEADQLGLSGTPTFLTEGPGVEGTENLGTPSSAGPLETGIDEAG